MSEPKQLFSKNVQLDPPKKLSSWRKVAIGTWDSPGDPSVYGVLDVDVESALRYLEKLRTKTSQKLTFTHFVGKAVAETLRRHPDINCVLRFGMLFPRKTVDVFFQVANDQDGKDLSGLTIRNADKKSVIQIADEMHEMIKSIREKGDPNFKNMKNKFKFAPGWISKWLIQLSGFILYTLNLWTPALGVPRDSFGGVMVTNIGSLGLDMAFAPIVPYSRVPLLLAVGSIRETPIARNGAISIAMISRICVTFDHRIIDGVQASKMTKTFQNIFADPEKELGGLA